MASAESERNSGQQGVLSRCCCHRRTVGATYHLPRHHDPRGQHHPPRPSPPPPRPPPSPPPPRTTTTTTHEAAEQPGRGRTPKRASGDRRESRAAILYWRAKPPPKHYTTVYTCGPSTQTHKTPPTPSPLKTIRRHAYLVQLALDHRHEAVLLVLVQEPDPRHAVVVLDAHEGEQQAEEELLSAVVRGPRWTSLGRDGRVHVCMYGRMDEAIGVKKTVDG